MTLTTDEIETIKSALWHYHLNKYHRITDYNKVVENREQVDENIYYYPCPLQDVYLDNDAYAVTYGRQSVYFKYYNEDDELLTDNNGVPLADLEEGEYSYRTGVVYYDPREVIPEIPSGYTGDTSLANILIRVADYEWLRDSSGGGGVIG